MSKRRKPGPPPRGQVILKKGHQVLGVLDSFSSADIKSNRTKWALFSRYQWDYYNSLAYLRYQKKEEIKQALLEASKESLEFKRWQRVQRLKWALKPLSAKGSLKDPGGRFNIGDIDSQRYSAFPALYLAEDFDTALQEHLGQDFKASSKLTPYQFALSKRQSFYAVALSGKLESYIDLGESSSLQPFVDIIKKFKLPGSLNIAAKKLGLPAPTVIESTTQLVDTLLLKDWRAAPMQVDIPANPQIFGQLIKGAGIQGIVYPSKFNNKPCVVVFPENFSGSVSYIEIADEAPSPAGGKPVVGRLDDKTWHELC